MAKTGIIALPADLIVEFTRFIDPVSVSQFSQTCKPLYELLRPERLNAARKHAWMPERDGYKRYRDQVDPTDHVLFCAMRLLGLPGTYEGYDGPNVDRTPQLLSAIHQGRAGVLRGYLEAGVDPNSFCGKSRLLSEAACFDNMECVKILLEYGADPALLDESGRPFECPKTALSRAAMGVFQPHLSGGSWFTTSEWKPEYDRVTRLMKAGVRITHLFEISWIRWQFNFLDILKLAVEQGTDLANLPSLAVYGTTVLHPAIAYADEDHKYRFFYPGTQILCQNDYEIVEWIITKYPELINHRDYRGETPFDWAISVGRCDIARLLLFRGFELGYAEKHSWYSEVTQGEVDIEKIDLLLEMREQLMNYDGVYYLKYVRRPRLPIWNF